jgi:eukaryotic-like serine/threonine-protein kinase
MNRSTTEFRLLSDRYRVEAFLGQGGMARVHRGTDLVLDRTIAVKILAGHMARDAQAVRRFRREAQAAAGLSHPGIVGVYDTGSDGDVHYIVMEFVTGQTLADVLQERGSLQPVRATGIASAVASALGHAHRKGIVHRDVKPANVMITPSGEVKVMDFGIARAVDSDPLTQTAGILGTATYFAPEQARGEPVDSRSDIYAAWSCTSCSPAARRSSLIPPWRWPICTCARTPLLPHG